MTEFRLPSARADYLELVLAADGLGVTAWWGTQWSLRSAARWPRPGDPPDWQLAASSFSLSADGDWVSTFDPTTSSVQVIRVGAKKPFAVLPCALVGPGSSITVAPGGDEVAWVSGSYLFVHRLPGGELVKKLRAGAMTHLGYDRGGRWLSGTADRAVRLFDREAAYKPVRLEAVRYAHASVAGARAVFKGPNPQSFTVWELPAGKPVAVLPAAPPDGWGCVAAVSADGRRVLTSNTAGDVSLWDAGGTRLKQYAWGLTAIALAFAPDGLTAAAGGNDGRVVVWDLDD